MSWCNDIYRSTELGSNNVWMCLYPLKVRVAPVLCLVGGKNSGVDGMKFVLFL